MPQGTHRFQGSEIHLTSLEASSARVGGSGEAPSPRSSPSPHLPSGASSKNTGRPLINHVFVVKNMPRTRVPVDLAIRNCEAESVLLNRAANARATWGAAVIGRFERSESTRLFFFCCYLLPPPFLLCLSLSPVPLSLSLHVSAMPAYPQ